jgi:hypothetical protein
MRLSRVLLAGTAVAAAGIATSAFTSSNPISAGNDTAGYGEVTTSGVTVSNVAYNPVANEANMLDNIVFTVGKDTTGMKALLTVSTVGGPIASSPITCGPWQTDTITCDVPNTVAIETITKIGLTVVNQ